MNMTTTALPTIRVLLVDDDDSWQIFTRDLLKGVTPHFDITPARDVDEAIRLVANAEYDVAVIDYWLGERNGIELLQSAVMRAADLPAIMLTSDEAVDAEAMAAGAVDYLVKHEITSSILQRALRYAVERHRTVSLLMEQDAHQAHLASIVESSDDAIFSRTLDGGIVSWNRGAERLYGFSADEAVGQPVSMIVAEQDQHHLPSISKRILEGQCVRTELMTVRKDGHQLPVLMTISPTLAPDGRLIGSSTVAHDLTERKRALQELDLIFNLSPDLLCTANLQGYFMRTNASWDALGYSKEQLRTTPFLEFVHPDDRTATEAELGRLGQGHTTFGFANRYRTARGDYRWIEWHSKADLVTGVIYAVGRDQTERRSLEQQFRQAQKMDAVGRLAGGVAHDFNNILTVITGFSEMLLEHARPDDSAHHDAQEIMKACQRAAALTRQLLAFSRKQLLAPEVLDPGVVVSRMNAMLGRIIGEDIALTISCPPDIGCVSADRGQLEQIVLNLAVNARDAMPSGGSLDIALANVELDGSFVAVHPGSAKGPHVVLAVTDTGSGMTEEVRSRLFEPFFTTKETGKGTGLGLATVYGIVKQSGGSIWVYSEPGLGTTFKLYFPRVDAAPTAAAAEPSHPARGTETILVVEDQSEVREVVDKTLTRHGYRVLQAIDGDHAIALLESHTGPLHLLLTDVVMPKVSGREVAERVRARRPNVPVLYMSGYTDDAVLRHGVSTRDTAFVEKPFTSARLLRMVRAVLDTPRPEDQDPKASTR